MSRGFAPESKICGYLNTVKQFLISAPLSGTKSLIDRGQYQKLKLFRHLAPYSSMTL
jgi:hypothetical protein